MAMYVVYLLDSLYDVDKPGPLVNLINSKSPIKFLLWGTSE